MLGEKWGNFPKALVIQEKFHETKVNYYEMNLLVKKNLYHTKPVGYWILILFATQNTTTHNEAPFCFYPFDFGSVSLFMWKQKN